VAVAEPEAPAQTTKPVSDASDVGLAAQGQPVVAAEWRVREAQLRPTEALLRMKTCILERFACLLEWAILVSNESRAAGR
jgi:hypothetical protein